MSFSPLLKKCTLAVTLAALGGCSTLTPMEHNGAYPTTAAKAIKKASTYSGWNDTPVVNDGGSSVVLKTPAKLPKSVYDKHISFRLDPGATIKDIVAVLGEKGIPVVLPDEKVGEKSFYIPYYNGNLGDLLATLSQTTNTWFTWSNGFIVASSYARIAIDIPQEQSFGEALKRGLTAMGVGHGSLSWEAGMATADVTPSDYRKVKAFLTQLTNNAVVVNLQVAIINVTLNQDANQGVNWAALSVAATKNGSLTTSNNSSISGNSTSSATQFTIGGSPTTGSTGGQGATGTGGQGATGTGGQTTPGVTTPVSPDSQAPYSITSSYATVAQTVGGLVASGGSLQGLLFNNRFSFSGMFDYLESYGDANTSQNVILRTIAGNPVKFKSVTQVPYVSQVGVTTSNGSAGSSSLGSTSTSTANDGIEVQLGPTYDASADTVTVDFKLSVQAVLGFNNLSAGNQIGSLSQPTTADQTLLNILRMRPGQTVVVGGLTYNTVSDSKNAPIALVGSKLEHQSLTVKRQTMFVVIRPTIVKFGAVKEVPSNGDDDSIAGAVIQEGAKLSSSDMGSSSSGNSSSSLPTSSSTSSSLSNSTTTSSSTNQSSSFQF